MNQEEINSLEKELWDAANDLRANSKLTAGEYKDPLLGLVLLRFAQNRYEDAKIQVEKKLPINPRTGFKRDATNDDYAAEGAIKLPEKAKYDYLAALPESENIADAINNAMKLIEAEYNAGKTLENTIKAFDDLNEFIQELTVEEQRAVRENLENQESLAIFDLLREGKKLEGKELKQVKKVAKETLDKLKTEKLKIERWRESRQITAQVKGLIYDNLLWLPQDIYTDEDVSTKTITVYQHIYSSYYGGGKSIYQQAS